MSITNIFLKAKHWHLFLLTFGLPTLFQFVMIGSTIASISSGEHRSPTYMGNMAILPIIMILFIGTFFGWFWSVAIGLQSKVPAGVKMKTTKFKIIFFTPMVYALFLFIAVGISIGGVMHGGGKPNPGLIAGMMAIIVPLHLFSMFCVFYSLYFVAKTIKTVELQRETSFSDFAGEFFMVWFFPIGIWILQPKINKMIENKTTPSLDV